jgi:hypothetical protein
MWLYQVGYCFVLLPGVSKPYQYRRKSASSLDEVSSRENRGDKMRNGITEDHALLMRQQDDEFCRRMIMAIETGRESCPVGVSKEPCTTNPVIADGWKHPCVRMS